MDISFLRCCTAKNSSIFLIVNSPFSCYIYSMTDEEAWALSDYITNNEITLGSNGCGWLSQREIRNLGLQTETVQYLFNKPNELNKSPAQIIDELVCKEMAAAV